MHVVAASCQRAFITDCMSAVGPERTRRKTQSMSTGAGKAIVRWDFALMLSFMRVPGPRGNVGRSHQGRRPMKKVLGLSVVLKHKANHGRREGHRHRIRFSACARGYAAVR